MIPPDYLKRMEGCIGLDFPAEEIRHLFEHIRELEAQCAAMRVALEGYVYAHGRGSERCWCYGSQEGIHDAGCIRARAALASDAGKALLERLETAEKEARRFHEWLHAAPIVQEARAQAFEEAAQVAEAYPYGPRKDVDHPDGIGAIAAAIRAKAAAGREGT